MNGIGRNVCVCGLVVAALAPAARASDPWADSWLSYAPGSNPAGGAVMPASSLGEPARFSPNANPEWASIVSPFSPAYLPEHIVSLGAGGSLVVGFSEPVTDDAANPFGIDLLVFGNALLEDAAWPSGVATGNLFAGNGVIEVSTNGTNWVLVPNIVADAAYPTLGYSDLTNGYATTPGAVPSDFTRPVNPAFSFAAGMTMADIQAAYAGSGGGAGVDLGALGLTSISFVRITNPTGQSGTVEIDGFADVSPVPGPAGVIVLSLGALGFSRRRRA